ncbi:hypothetical protein B0H15DRAFT_916981 [Mycena belliarum]|uniref:F-box domain-containing protein n=1 Tax=Mycena belliarum TaxID=1033014 RepID=A0AAD6TU56_9AGAR|nr:hypothetical protein B0H15DRAFT_916981 [Mycena belliae]
MPDLPSELWTQIFDLAADQALILQHRLPTAMSGLEHFHQNNLGGWSTGWSAESMQQQLNWVQRRSYRTKKAIVLTCKRWRALEHESLFRFLCFRAAPSRLCDILDTSAAAATTTAASLGWWTRRIHADVTFDPMIQFEEVHNALVRILRHCPNLEILVVPRTLHGSFSAIADALVCHAANSLRALCINIQAPMLHELLATLPALPYICAAHINLHPGGQHVITPAGSDDRIRLPHLQQLSLSGCPHQLIHVAKHWHLPALRALSLSCNTPTEAHHPAIPAFLAAHGAQLTALELYSKPDMPMPLARMLAACPALTTLAFNGDWAFDLSSDEGAPQGTPPFAHACLARVGLHGLGLHGLVPELYMLDTPLEAEREAARMNERALALLCDRARFPALRCLRVLSVAVVRERERVQHDWGDAARRLARAWAHWDRMLARAEIQLEDCFGEVLPPWPWDYTERHEDEVKQAED